MMLNNKVEVLIVNCNGTNQHQLPIKTEIDYFSSASANADSSQAQEKINFRTDKQSSQIENNYQEIINIYNIVRLDKLNLYFPQSIKFKYNIQKQCFKKQNYNNICKNKKGNFKKEKKNLKELQKQIKQQNIRETNIYYEQLQNELYRKALLKLEEGDISIKQKIIKAYRDIEPLVTDSAFKYAQRYCQKYEIIDINQIILLYKILLLPEEVLSKFVKVEDKGILRQEYKFYAMNIHPDKNKHQKALFAFQKMKKYWNDIPNQSHN